MPSYRSRAALFVCSVVALACPPASAQSPCDPKLLNTAQSYGYRDRSDRCEGAYDRRVSGTAVLLALLATSSIEDLCADRSRKTYFVWSLPPNDAKPAEAVRLQVESLRRALPYRMETTRPSGSATFEWPREPRCSNQVDLRASEVGALAKTSIASGAKPIEVLLPVALATSADARPAPPYSAILVSARPIEEVHVSLWHLPDGQDPVRIYTERALGKRPYPTNTAIRVPVSAADVKAPGLYRLRLSLELAGGSPDPLDYYFLHGR